jgi:hypothetical protein
MTKKRLGSERTREALLLHVWQTRDSARALAAHEREIAAEALEKAARTIVRETRRIAMMPSCAKKTRCGVQQYHVEPRPHERGPRAPLHRGAQEGGTMTLPDLVVRLSRLGLTEAAQIVERYASMAAELHAARQRIVALESQVARLEDKK